MRWSTVPRQLAAVIATTILTLSASAAHAQYDDPGAYDGASDEGVPTPMDEPGQGAEGTADLPGPAPDFSRAPQTYTVQQGDTLWDITSTYLGNPWYWPKVWSMNGQIENPNWIEPGTTISFFGGEQLPTEVEPEEQPQPIDDESNEVTVVGPRFETPQSIRLLEEGFVTGAELKSAGELISSFEEKTLLTTYDKAYVKFPTEVSIGARYVIFRTDREIMNPDTGKSAGFMTRILGIGRITAAPQGKFPTIAIEGVQDTISRGDLLMPWNESLGRTVMNRPNQVELDGIVLATFMPKQVTIGESHFVFVNKGRRHGVEVGNTFTVYQRGDPLDIDLRQKERQRLPWEAIGRVMIIEVRDEVSTAVVVRSLREIVVGDRAQMRVGGATAAR